MTISYIAWDDDRLCPLVHGVAANIPPHYSWQHRIHGHACTTCGQAHVCLCFRVPREKRRELRRCPWCTQSWEFRWAKAEPVPKPRRRRTTRRPLRPVA